MTTIHLVSHTHWDREWYLPYQVFHLKLVQLVDNLLDLMKTHPEYQYFMLDGQTIVLDDYLQIRPERRDELVSLVQNGRLLIGPWHILPDEFLVSPEATIRNLLEGNRTARQFGVKMCVGYIPDPFGHIGQMPQILRGFGIETACVQRGLSNEPCEFWWQSPDGSRVFMAYLRDGYGGGAGLVPSDPESFTSGVRLLRDSLLPYSASSHLLLMQGNDHMEPLPETPLAIAYAQDKLDGDTLLHSSLPAYLAAVRSEMDEHEISVISGELRSSRRYHLLPGVLSSRMWIKQRNHTCQTLLEKWAEPFSAWASLLQDERPGRSVDRINNPQPILRYAWRLLMECHPHDSICGCSIDQVHEEMRPRFDQVEQIGEGVTRQSLASLLELIDTQPPDGILGTNLHSQAGQQNACSAMTVFNPCSWIRSESVKTAIQLAGCPQQIKILDEAGQVQPCRLVTRQTREVANMTLTKEQFQTMLGSAQGGRIIGMPIQKIHFHRKAEILRIQLELAESGGMNEEVLAAALPVVLEAISDPSLTTFVVRAGITENLVEFLAKDIPGMGYKTFWAFPDNGDVESLPAIPPEYHLENEYLSIDVSTIDGSLTLVDKRSGAVYPGLNRFIDGGDCGDEYNYCPPDLDSMISADSVERIDIKREAVEQAVEIALSLTIPLGLTPDRQARSAETGRMLIYTRVSLFPGVPRLDVHTRVSHAAGDHRLRVHFPAPYRVETASYDGHFEIVRRPTGIPEYDESWAEAPRPEQPQRAFTSITNGITGLMIANRGLPEVEVFSGENETEIILTLLRCTGWLSRDDLSNRKGHAGPGLPTPGAQMIGGWDFDYAIIPYSVEPGSMSHLPPQHAAEQAHAFNAPLRAVSSRLHPGQLSRTSSLLGFDTPGFWLSSIKTAEDGQGWIVRGYTLGDGPRVVRLTPGIPCHLAWRTNLAEANLEELAVNPDGSISFPMESCQVATIRFIP